MRGVEVGSICIKTAGREAGQKAVVLEEAKGGIVVIEGPYIKKRKCNIAHLFPTGKTIKVTKSMTKKELLERIQ